MPSHDPRRWAKDTSTPKCQSCSALFTVLLRRHHCRSCGEIFCESCCNKLAIVPGAQDTSSKEKVRVCAQCAQVIERVASTIASAVSGSTPSTAVTAASRYALYLSFMASSIHSVALRRQRALTRAANTLSIDVPALKDEVKKIVLPADAAGGNMQSPSSSPNKSDSSTQPRREDSAGGTTGERSKSPVMTSVAEELLMSTGSIALRGSLQERRAIDSISPSQAMGHFFSGASTARLRQLEHRITQLYQRSVSVYRILERKSLSHFYLEIYRHLEELLQHSFIASSYQASVGGTAGISEAQHSMSFRRLQLHGADVTLAASAALSKTLLHLECLRRGEEEQSLLGAQKCEILDDFAEQLSVAITVRYEEQISCLTEKAAETLATTAAARIHHRVHTHCTASEDDFSILLYHVPLEDYMFDAILHERPAAVREQGLQTRLRNVDVNWTDHGALSCCGLRTSDGKYFDPLYLGSTAENTGGGKFRSSVKAAARGDKPDAAPAPTSPTVARTTSVAGKYYYRLGTVAEANAIKMTSTSNARHTASPLWSSQMLFEQYQLLCNKRDDCLTSYSCLPFCDLNGNSWMSLLGTMHVMDSSSTRGNNGESVIYRLDLLRGAIRRCQDGIANTEAFRNTLIRRYQTMHQELEAIQSDVEQLKLRAEDIHDTSSSSAESRGLLAAIDRISTINNGEHLQQRLLTFQRYRGFLNVSGPATNLTHFYVHLRVRLLMVLLAASRCELQDDPVQLMNAIVPYSPKVGTVVDAMYAQASRSAVCKSWNLPDVVDLHVERMSRILSDRFRDTLELLSPASVSVFADCCVARLFFLFSNGDEAIPASRPAAAKKNEKRRMQSATVSTYDTLLEVATVERIDKVALFDTLVKAKKVYLTLADGKSTLCEHGIHTKSALCDLSGNIFVGLPTLANSPSPTGPVMHHKGPKYGSLHAYPGEIERKQLVRANADWSIDPKYLVKPKKGIARFFSSNDTVAAQVARMPSLIQQVPADRLHWASSSLSVGPRLVGPGEFVGVTLIPRNKLKEPTAIPDELRKAIAFVPLSGEDGRAASVREVGSKPTTPSGGVPPLSSGAEEGSSNAVVSNFQCSIAGNLIVAAEWNHLLLIGNSVCVRPGRVDWPHHCSLDVSPTTVVAGNTVTATVTLRDEFGNITSTTNPEDFTVSIDNNGVSVVASTMTEEVGGTYRFVFVPTNEGPLTVAVTAAGETMSFTRTPLRCIAAPPDFKNSMFSLDEWDVVAGNIVHGNLLLRDIFGNKVEAEDEHPCLELINGATISLPVERVNRGEYIFSFCPTKQGCAILRATSLRNFQSLVVRVNVEAPKDVDMSASSVSCLSKVLFAGEAADFHIVMKDKYGNSVDAQATAEDFECWLEYVDGESSNGDNEIVRATCVTGSGASFAFRVTAGVVGDVIACARLKGFVLESSIMKVRSAPLHWPSSHVVVATEANVGEWVPVQINCKDRFGNPSDAQETDFSVVVVHDASSNTETSEDGKSTSPTIKTKPVSGAGSHFGFQLMGTKSGVTKIIVTYAGYLKHECEVRLLPIAPSWNTCVVSVKPTAASSSNAVVAGQELKIIVLLRDQYGNWTRKHSALEKLALHADNEGTLLALEVVRDDEDSNDEDSSWCRAVFLARPTVAGRVHVKATWVDALNTSEEKTCRCNVVASAVDWSLCKSTLNPSQDPSRIIAGTPLITRVALFDSFGNPVEAHPNALSVTCLNSTTDYRDESLDVMCDVRVVSHNELMLQATPELSGVVNMTVFLDTETNPCYALGIASTEAKVVLMEVLPAAVDWLGRTHCLVPASVVAGERFSLELFLRDTLNNPVPIESESIGQFHVQMEEARNNSTKVLLQGSLSSSSSTSHVFAVKSAERGLLQLETQLSVAGAATLRVLCDGTARPQLSVEVNPAAAVWANTDVLWSDTELCVGVEAMCRIAWRDQFGNLTSTGSPSVEQLEAFTEHFALEIVPKPSFESSESVAELEAAFVATLPRRLQPTTSTSRATLSLSPDEHLAHLEARFVTEVAGKAKLSLRYVGSLPEQDVLYSADIDVSAASPSWPHCALLTVPHQTPRLAGEVASAILILRDRFTNDCPNVVRNAPSDLRIQLLLGADIVPEVFDVQPCSEDSSNQCHFQVTFVPRKAGNYSLCVGLRSESDTLDLAVDFPIEAGPVDWASSRFFADHEHQIAGEGLFYQLECHDCHGNATNRALDLSSLQLNVHVLDADKDLVGDASSASTVSLSPGEGLQGVFTTSEFFVLPQQVGLYAITVTPTTTGRFQASVVDRTNEDKSLRLTAEVVDVSPNAVEWTKCSLVSQSKRPVAAGGIFLFGIVLRDRYGNLLKPLDRFTATDENHSASNMYGSFDNKPFNRGESQDDLTQDMEHALQHHSSGAGGARHANHIDDFCRMELPGLVFECQNQSATGAMAELEVMCSASHLSDISADELSAGPLASASIICSVSPRLEGHLRLSASNSGNDPTKLELTENAVVIAHDPSQATALTDLRCVTAGSPLTLDFRVSDSFGNTVSVDCSTILTVDVSPWDPSIRASLSWTPATSDAGGAPTDSCCTIQLVVHKAATYSITLMTLKKVAISAPIQILVVPGPLSVAESIFALPPNAQPSAGESFCFSLFAFDAFKNAILNPCEVLQWSGSTAETDFSKAQLTCVNGTSRPSISCCFSSESVGGDGGGSVSSTNALRLEVTPQEKGTLVLVLQEANGGARKSSDSVAVQPAPLHWANCILRIADDSVQLGSTVNLLFQGRDRFQNPVEADSSIIALEIVNDGVVYPVSSASAAEHGHHLAAEDEGPAGIDCDGFRGKGKTLLCEVKPMSRGALFARVRCVSDATTEVKLSNTIPVL